MGGRRHGWRRVIGWSALALFALGALFAPMLAPQPPHEQFDGYAYAPPMRPHVFSADGHLRRPFVYRLRLVDRLERRYEADRSQPVPLTWLTCGRLLCPPAGQPLLLLGGDALGRDVWARLLSGGRLSLGIAAAATGGSLLIGLLVGALAASTGGWIDELLMRLADLVLALPVIYVLLVLRGALPLVLDPSEVFLGLATALILVCWPQIARGVRAIVSVEASQPFVEAARAAGAGSLAILCRHTLPAARGFVLTQAALLVPAIVLAEATLSYAGFGFSEPVASWGTMLHDAGSVDVFTGFPWLLAPAAAIAALSIAIRAVAEQRGDPSLAESPSQRAAGALPR